jgi:plastocyanin
MATALRFVGASLLCLVLTPPLCCAQMIRVTGKVLIERNSKQVRGAEPQPTTSILWLTPLAVPRGNVPAFTKQEFRLTQKDKHFSPELLVIPVGSSVQFPNRDPFFHNVFSLFEGKRFDLGLYQSGETRAVRFDREGVSYIFCNIHPEMHAVVVALPTPLYGVPDASGAVTISDVPPGRYMLHVWYERAAPDTLHNFDQVFEVSEHHFELPVLRLQEDELFAEHKNKFGKDYDHTSQTPLY